MISGRALHFVFKIGDRAKNINFFRNILGMKVLRHEEFNEGCDAQCNGPYDNRWSKTMIGYGPESNHFVIELTYNYGVKNYVLGNDFVGLTIRSAEVIERAKQNNYEIGDNNVLTSPDGYKFYILNEPQPSDQDPVEKVTLNCSDLNETSKYWHNVLDMNIISKQENQNVVLTYNKFQLQFNRLDGLIDHAKAYGRIAFSVPKSVQEQINEKIQTGNYKILTQLITLDTPGKSSVRVIILADPDSHEICFVDEEGFFELSAVDPDSDNALNKFIKKDPFQDKLDG